MGFDAAGLFLWALAPTATIATTTNTKTVATSVTTTTATTFLLLPPLLLLLLLPLLPMKLFVLRLLLRLPAIRSPVIGS